MDSAATRNSKSARFAVCVLDDALAARAGKHAIVLQLRGVEGVSAALFAKGMADRRRDDFLALGTVRFFGIYDFLERFFAAFPARKIGVYFSFQSRFSALFISF